MQVENRVGERLVALDVGGTDETRIDHFLAASLPEFSRSRLQGFIRDGLVSVNGSVALKAGLLLKPGSKIEVHIPPTRPSTLQGEDIPLDIIFENDDLVVVNKPAGMVVHPSPGHERGTLVHALLHHAPGIEGIGGEERPGVVHRLDKDTSGLILLAKNDSTHQWLQDQFRSRKVKKTYLALVDGAPPTPKGSVDAPIGRDPAHRKKMSILPPGKGRAAISEYRVLLSFPQHTLLEVHPLTGRTHQIRLHLAFLGCPVVGDPVYGSRKNSLQLKRHFLHAFRLQITLPNEVEPRSFEAELPEELEAALRFLKETEPAEGVTA